MILCLDCLKKFHPQYGAICINRHTHIYMHIYIYTCVCVYIYIYLLLLFLASRFASCLISLCLFDRDCFPRPVSVTPVNTCLATRPKEKVQACRHLTTIKISLICELSESVEGSIKLSLC